MNGSNFVYTTNETVVVDGIEYKNRIVNLARVMSFGRMTLKHSVGPELKSELKDVYVINFTGSNSTSICWTFRNKEERDDCFYALMAKVK